MSRPTHWLRQPARPARLRVEWLEDRVVPDGGRPLPFPVIYAGAGEGHAPVVKAYDAETGALNFERPVFDPAFLGGVRVAAADFSADGFPDVVVAPGPGGGPNVKVLDGKTGDQIPGPLGSFFAYDPAFAGGVEVAAADVDGDGFPDLVTGAGVGGAAHVQVFGGRDGALLASFLSFDVAFRGGVSVAAADLTGDGKAEVVTGAGPGGGPHVKVLDALTGEPIPGPLGSFFAFDPDTPGGANVAADWKAGDADADGVPDLAVGTGPGAANRVRVFSGATGAVLADFAPFDPAFAGGVRAGLAYVDDDGRADVVVGTGPGTPAAVRVFSGATGAQLPPPQGEYAPFGPDFAGGVSVAASNDPPYVSVAWVADAVEPATSTGSPVAVGRFRVTASPAATSGFSVNYTLGGTATAGTDYNSATYAVAFIPGQATADVTITPKWDGLAEGAESVVITLTAGTGYTVDTPSAASLQITDTLPPPPPPPPPPTGSIGDHAWYDTDADGVKDAGESAAPGVAVTLTLGGTQVGTATTDSAGNYLFTGLAAGTYAVAFAKSGYSFSTPAGGSKAVALAAGAAVRDADAGLIPNGAVGDLVWEDQNRNGLQDLSEPGVSGAAVDLYPLPSGSPRRATTDANGAYWFADVPPGQYVARVSLPSGFQFTAPWVTAGGVAPAAGLTPAGSDSEADPIYAWTNTFAVAPGQLQQGVDVGAYRPPAGSGTAFGTVWDDANGDGLQAGEAGLSGVRVDILDAAGTTALGWAVTGPKGGYTFPALAPGTYTLRVRAAYALSPKDVGANDAIDSDFDPATSAVAFTVSAGQAVFRDAGVRRPPAVPAVGDRAWVDTDRNGVQDLGEPGLPGVIVRLRDGALTVVAETTTDAGGWYSFGGSGRAGNTYHLVFIPPAGYRLTHAGAGSDPAADSDPDPVTSTTGWFTFPTGSARLDLDAGAVPTAGAGAIAGTVWDDRAATFGLRGAGEAGLPGVTVELLDGAGAAVLDGAGVPRTAKTGAQGGYVFPGLPAGTYKVRVQPVGPLSPLDYGSNGYDGADSDFDPATRTTALVSVAAGGLLTLDAGVASPLDLDVDGDGKADGLADYLPGYQGNVAKLSTAVEQKMTLTLTGLEKNKKYKVSLKGTSTHPGIASNMSAAAGKFPSGPTDPDFVLVTAGGAVVADGTDLEVTTDATNGTASVSLWCRDFGGRTTVVLKDENGKAVPGGELPIPLDTDEDTLPDKWETLYSGAGLPTGFTGFDKSKKQSVAGTDDGTRDDDRNEGGKTGKNVGDRLPAFDEYRGFSVQAAHTRINPTYKQIFVLSDDRDPYLAANMNADGLNRTVQGPELGVGMYADDLDAEIKIISRFSDIDQNDVDQVNKINFNSPAPYKGIKQSYVQVLMSPDDISADYGFVTMVDPAFSNIRGPNAILPAAKDANKGIKTAHINLGMIRTSVASVDSDGSKSKFGDAPPLQLMVRGNGNLPPDPLRDPDRHIIGRDKQQNNVTLSLFYFAAGDKMRWHDRNADAHWDRGDELWVDGNGDGKYSAGDTLIFDYDGNLQLNTVGVLLDKNTEFRYVRQDGTNTAGKYTDEDEIYTTHFNRTLYTQSRDSVLAHEALGHPSELTHYTQEMNIMYSSLADAFTASGYLVDLPDRTVTYIDPPTKFSDLKQDTELQLRE